MRSSPAVRIPSYAVNRYKDSEVKSPVLQFSSKPRYFRATMADDQFFAFYEDNVRQEIKRTERSFHNAMSISSDSNVLS